MAGGHKVDPAQLSAAAKALSEIPKQTLEAPLAAVKDVQLGPPDFGLGHQMSFGPYKPAVLRLATMADNYLKAADEFAQKLTASGGKYQANEQGTTQSVKESGK
jgi:predicted ATP-dependent Lon-type protease